MLPFLISLRFCKEKRTAQLGSTVPRGWGELGGRLTDSVM